MSTPAKVTLTPPAGGAKISIQNGKLHVPDNPIIPYIEGDGTGPDIWRSSVRVIDAAVDQPPRSFDQQQLPLLFAQPADADQPFTGELKWHPRVHADQTFKSAYSSPTGEIIGL